MSYASRPLFGGAESVFRMGQTEFCEHVVHTLQHAAEELGEPLDGDATDAVGFLSKRTKADVLELATSLCVELGKLVPLRLDATLLEAFQEEARVRKVTMVANTGEISSVQENVRIMLQFDALDEVCAPPVALPPRIEEFRKRLLNRLCVG